MKSKHYIIIYSIISIFITSLIIPTISICFNENETYKWSTSTLVQTSIVPSNKEQSEIKSEGKNEEQNSKNTR